MNVRAALTHTHMHTHIDTRTHQFFLLHERVRVALVALAQRTPLIIVTAAACVLAAQPALLAARGLARLLGGRGRGAPRAHGLQRVEAVEEDLVLQGQRGASGEGGAESGED